MRLIFAQNERTNLTIPTTVEDQSLKFLIYEQILAVKVTQAQSLTAGC